jgi:DNA-binding NarL/FixJ family response regulator
VICADNDWVQGYRAMARNIRALIVDDRPRSRRGLRALLATSPEIQVIGEATNGQEAIVMVDKFRPDVVLMDVRMPVMDGLEATRRIKSKCPSVQVIVLTLYNAYRNNALAAGAAAFLVKGGPSEELLETIRLVDADLSKNERARVQTGA